MPVIVGKTLQLALFERISKQLGGNNKKLSKEISDLFNITSNVVYDRINAKKLLNIEEIAMMAKHFNISMDELISPVSTSFELSAYEKQPDSFAEYLMTILKDLRQLAMLPDCKITYVASETPFFYYLYTPVIALFKMYVWGRTVWDLPELENQTFDIEQLNTPETEALIEELLALYVKFPTTEVWNTNMIDTTLNQINHCLYCGFFKEPSDAIALVEALEKMVNKMEEIVKNGKKSKEGISVIYNNELMQNSTLILVGSPYLKALYLVFDSPNLMISHSTSLFEHTYKYYEKIERFSLHLNEERQRLRFFKVLRAKLEATKANFSKAF